MVTVDTVFESSVRLQKAMAPHSRTSETPVRTRSLRRHGQQSSFRYERTPRVRTLRNISSFREQQPTTSHIRDLSTASTTTEGKEGSTAQELIRNREIGLAAVRLFLLALALAFLAVTVVTLIGDPSSQVPTQLGTVSVHGGDTLSSIAGQVAPEADTGAVVQRIKELNSLKGVSLYPGQVLIVPMS